MFAIAFGAAKLIGLRPRYANGVRAAWPKASAAPKAISPKGYATRTHPCQSNTLNLNKIG
ncbi:MAG: hypothetical protein F6K26_51620 [Moorea sp. SIO2I5]|nr:hypothetical protein [Moorena sp. SIO2I5]